LTVFNWSSAKRSAPSAATVAARCGRALDAHVLGVDGEPEDVPLALCDEGGALVAIAARRGGAVRVLRGFVPRTSGA